mmetsp:Transcript_19185/g.41548  ORF Transcript_19185/g.41548 Transcript_19185/m.41548 type:complete len:342 (-) Transcript_19185:1453-2478(-)
MNRIGTELESLEVGGAIPSFVAIEPLRAVLHRDFCVCCNAFLRNNRCWSRDLDTTCITGGMHWRCDIWIYHKPGFGTAHDVLGNFLIIRPIKSPVRWVGINVRILNTGIMLTNLNPFIRLVNDWEPIEGSLLVRTQRFVTGSHGTQCLVRTQLKPFHTLAKFQGRIKSLAIPSPRSIEPMWVILRCGELVHDGFFVPAFFLLITAANHIARQQLIVHTCYAPVRAVGMHVRVCNAHVTAADLHPLVEAVQYRYPRLVRLVLSSLGSPKGFRIGTQRTNRSIRTNIISLNILTKINGFFERLPFPPFVTSELLGLVLFLGSIVGKNLFIGGSLLDEIVSEAA